MKLQAVKSLLDAAPCKSTMSYVPGVGVCRLREGGVQIDRPEMPMAEPLPFLDTSCMIHRKSSIINSLPCPPNGGQGPFFFPA